MLTDTDRGRALGVYQLKNRVAVNFRSRSRRWLSLRISNIPYFQGLPDARIKSWTRLLYWAGTTTAQTIVGLLPRYTSLQTPPQPVLAQLQSFIYQMRSSIGLLGLPVTGIILISHPEAYLPWMWQVLSDLTHRLLASQAAGCSHSCLRSATNHAASPS